MPCWKEMAVLLSGSALRKSFGARVLFENLSLSLSEGDRTGLIGPNGSGKTTLLEILAGKEAPDAGMRALRKQTRLAYVPQDSLFAPDDTVGSVLRAALDGLPLEEEEKRARTGDDAGPGRLRELRYAGRGALRRMEEAARHRGRAGDVAGRAASGRADQSPGPGRHPVAGDARSRLPTPAWWSPTTGTFWRTSPRKWWRSTRSIRRARSR